MANTPNPDSPTGAVTLWVNGRDARDGAATLTPITDTTSGHIVHLVTVDRRAAECYGIRQPDGVIGGLVRMRGRWSPTAYRDRSHLLTCQGPTYFLPYARSRACAVRGLLRWWWTVERRTRDGANPGQLDPFQESAKFRRWLMV